MKLSELSYREYVALEALPKFAGTMPDDEAAWRAFSVADAFLKQASKENTRVADSTGVRPVIDASVSAYSLRLHELWNGAIPDAPAMYLLDMDFIYKNRTEIFRELQNMEHRHDRT